MALRRVSDLPNLDSAVPKITKDVLKNCLIEVSYADPNNSQGTHVYQSYFVNLYDALSAFNAQ